MYYLFYKHKQNNKYMIPYKFSEIFQKMYRMLFQGVYNLVGKIGKISRSLGFNCDILLTQRSHLLYHASHQSVVCRSWMHFQTI